MFYCLKLHNRNLGSFGPGKKKCRQFSICNLQFCKVPAEPPLYKVPAQPPLYKAG